MFCKAAYCPFFTNYPRKKYLHKAFVRFIYLVDENMPAPEAYERRQSTGDHRDTQQYIEVNPGQYNLQLLNLETGQPALAVPGVGFEPGQFYTVYALGESADEGPLSVFVQPDANPYMLAQ